MFRKLSRIFVLLALVDAVKRHDFLYQKHRPKWKFTGTCHTLKVHAFESSAATKPNHNGGEGFDSSEIAMRSRFIGSVDKLSTASKKLTIFESEDGNDE